MRAFMKAFTVEAGETEITEPHSGAVSAANTFQLMFTWRALKRNIRSNLEKLEREMHIHQHLCSKNIVVLIWKHLVQFCVTLPI